MEYDTENNDFRGRSHVHFREHSRVHFREHSRGSVRGLNFVFASSVLLSSMFYQMSVNILALSWGAGGYISEPHACVLIWKV